MFVQHTSSEKNALIRNFLEMPVRDKLALFT